jgi:hypothetical protein
MGILTANGHLLSLGFFPPCPTEGSLDVRAGEKWRQFGRYWPVPTAPVERPIGEDAVGTLHQTLKIVVADSLDLADNSGSVNAHADVDELW